MIINNIQFKARLGSAGIHFFNRANGTNILIDELIPPNEKWSSAPRQVSIALTNACDLDCSHCYAPKYPANIDFKRLKKWLHELDANGCIGVGFGGGEPTLYPKLVEICTYATTNTNLAVTMTSHAHQLNDGLLKKLSENVNFIRISMDGVGCTYESIRKRSFDNLVSRISAVSHISSFGINYVVNSKTFNDLDEAIKIATKFKASEFLLLPEVSIGRGIQINNETSNLLKNWIKKYRGSVPLAISEGHTDGLPTCEPLITETGLTAFAHIDASGVLKRSSYDTDGIAINSDGVLLALQKLRLKKDLII